MPVFKHQRFINQGFSLIELVAGIVIMAIAMAGMATLLYPMTGKSVDPIYQVRAAELGQSLLNEVLGKRFDENPQTSGGLLRCGETVFVACSVALGVDAPEVEGNPDSFDDVDDYNGYDETKAQLNNSSLYTNLYTGFLFSVAVVYDDDYNGTSNGSKLVKRVNISVTTPAGEVFKFAGYKANY